MFKLTVWKILFSNLAINKLEYKGANLVPIAVTTF